MSELKPIIDALLGAFTQQAIGEGRNLLRIKTLGLFIQLVGGIRRLLLVQYTLMIACFTWAVSFVGTAFVLAEQYDRDGTIRIFGSASLWVGAGLLALSTLGLWLTIREKTWLQALAIEKLMDQAMNEIPRPELSPAIDELSTLVSKLVEAKLEALARKGDT